MNGVFFVLFFRKREITKNCKSRNSVLRTVNKCLCSKMHSSRVFFLFQYNANEKADVSCTR